MTETFSHDAVGNRLSSLSVPSYTYNSSNEPTSIGKTNFTYDANGNTLTKATPSGTTSYAWVATRFINCRFAAATRQRRDFENRLTSVSLPNGVVGFKYDPFGRGVQSGPG